MENKQRLIIGLLTATLFLFAILLWTFVQYDFAGQSFYMFSVKGVYLAYGYIEGYVGFLLFGLPPFLALGAIACLTITILNKAAKVNLSLYASCLILALLSVIIYKITYFNITHRFGVVTWTISFWGAFTLYCINFVLMLYVTFINIRHIRTAVIQPDCKTHAD